MLSLITQSRARFEHVLLKIYIKSGNIANREEKRDFERFLIYLNIKMSAKSNKIEHGIELWLCGEKNRLFGMSCFLRIETKLKKTKVSEAAIGGVL